MFRRWLWVLLPVLSVTELGAHWFFSRRPPTLEQWQDIAEPVRRLKRPGDALVVSPRWAEPLARGVLGDDLWPVSDRARASFSGAPRVLEVSILNDVDQRLRTWPLRVSERVGPFRVTLRENPAYHQPLFNVVDAVTAGKGEVFRKHDGTRYECPWKANARPSTGGLHGHVAFPGSRFMCGEREVEFVGATIIDDQDFEPRRCVWAHPSRQGMLWLRFENVPLGERVGGGAGISHFFARAGMGTVIVMEVFVNGRKVGHLRNADRDGWSPFAFATGAKGMRGRLEFRIHSDRFENRHFCFAAETW